MPAGRSTEPRISGQTPWVDARGQASAAEESGRTRIWVTDEGAAVALAAGLGRVTDRLRIGLVVDPARRALTVLAKELTSLDVLIGGRLDVAVPATPAGDEAAAVLAGMGTGEPFDHDGPLAQARGARCLPPAAIPVIQPGHP